jgi:hypothetical protein
MKHIYKFSIILLAVFTFIGCNVDDDDAVTVLPMKELTASLVNQGDIIGVADDATSYDLVISFSEALPSYSTIEYSLDGGATTSSSASSGDDTLVISIPFDNNDNFHDINLSDFILVNASARRFTTSITGNSSVRVMRQGYFTATISWGNYLDDIDFGLQPMTASWGDTFDFIDTSLGIRDEFLEGTLDDGNYAIYAQFYTAATDVNVNCDMVTAAGNFVLDVLATEDGNVIWFTKSTNTQGNVSYTFYTEDPS